MTQISVHFVTTKFHNSGNKDKDKFVRPTALMNNCFYCQTKKITSPLQKPQHFCVNPCTFIISWTMGRKLYPLKVKRTHNVRIEIKRVCNVSFSFVILVRCDGTLM